MLKSNIKPHTLTKKPPPGLEGVYTTGSIFLDNTIIQRNTDVFINNNPVVFCDHETGDIYYQFNGIKTKISYNPPKQSKWVIFKERLIEGIRKFLLFLK